MLALIFDDDSATIAPQDGLKARKCKCLFFLPRFCSNPVTAFRCDAYHLEWSKNLGFGPQVISLFSCWTSAKTDAGVILETLKLIFNEMSHQITFPFREKVGKIAMSCKHVLQVKKCKLRAAGGRKQVPTLWVNNCKCFAISLPFPDTTAALIPHFTFILSRQLTRL